MARPKVSDVEKKTIVFGFRIPKETDDVIGRIARLERRPKAEIVRHEVQKRVDEFLMSELP